MEDLLWYLPRAPFSIPKAGLGALSWSPDGRLLAAGVKGVQGVRRVGMVCRARQSPIKLRPSIFLSLPFEILTYSTDMFSGSPDAPGLALFDVALGTSLRVGAGFSRIKTLQWSPDGGYLLAGEVVAGSYL